MSAYLYFRDELLEIIERKVPSHDGRQDHQSKTNKYWFCYRSSLHKISLQVGNQNNGQIFKDCKDGNG